MKMLTKRLLAMTLLISTLGACEPASIDAESPAPDPSDVQVMVLGTYHFIASTSDVISLESKSVLAPDPQAQLARISDSLAAFNPTHVVVERQTAAPEYIDPNYAAYGPEMLGKNENERVQLGYRLANQAKLTVVHGIDEQPSDGEPDYFPFGKLQKHAIETGQKAEFEAFLASRRDIVETAFSSTEHLPLADRLIDVNAGPLSEPGFYYEISQFDRGEDQAAAELQAYWFMRNAKIFSKLRNVTEAGDRVVVVYGAGHKFWLEHLVENTPGFTKIDPVPYLEAAK